MRTVTVREGGITLEWTEGSQINVPTLRLRNEASYCTDVPIMVDLDPDRVPQMSIAFARLAAELAALPPSDSKAYVDERDLGRTDHEERPAGPDLTEELIAIGMPAGPCPICGAGKIIGERAELDGSTIYFWSCDSCSYRGGRS